MGTTVPSSFDFESPSAWPEGKPPGDVPRELIHPKSSQMQSRGPRKLRGAFECKVAPTAGSGAYLESRWKGAAEQLRSSTERPTLCRTKSGNAGHIAQLVADNLSALKQALAASFAGIQNTKQLVHVRLDGTAVPVPRSYVLARELFRLTDFQFDENAFAGFLAVVQNEIPLEASELWSLKPFLQLELLEQLAGAISRSSLLADNVTSTDSPAVEEVLARLSSLLHALEGVSSIEWLTFVERVCATEQILGEDPVGTYARMDSETREAYRASVAEMAAHSDCSEPDVARKALALARLAHGNPALEGRAKERRSHVGYYLVDSGQDTFKDGIGYRPSFCAGLRDFILKAPDLTYVLTIEAVAFVFVAFLISFLHLRFSAVLGIALLLLPAFECAVATINMAATRLVPPRKLPKLDFSKGIPGPYSTIVAVPALLASEAQVRQAVRGLEVRYLANRDVNLHFALLSDLPDSTRQFDEREPLVDLAARLMAELDAKYARENKGRLFLLHRHRTYNEAEGVWMGWERKRGKLLDLNCFLLKRADPFPVKTGPLSVLSNIRYVITLDLDTQLPPGAARKLVGALAHPLNRAVIDSDKNTVVEGYGILQPRVDVSVKSASRSRFAGLLSGDTGFDIYTRAVSDVYQDLFGEGIFTGKGIYEVETFQQVLEDRFPCNTVLSHDLIEGLYARTGLVSDIEVVDDYPSHFSAFSRRKHRWVRGDWQIIFSLLPQIPNHSGQRVFNPLGYISRWKVLDNLRRSLTDFATLLLLLYGWMRTPNEALRWTIAALALVLLPACLPLLFAALSAGKAWFRSDFWEGLVRDLAGAISRTAIHLAFLCHQSLIDLDAIIRTVVRMKFTRRRLLEWETAADTELRNGDDNLVDWYLKCSVFLVLVVGPLVYLLHPGSLQIAMPFLSLWAASAWIGEWLNRPQPVQRIRAKDRKAISYGALRTWRFFREFSSPAENWLIPDIVQKAPPLTAHRVSPTNLGVLLNARLAAHDLGYSTTQEFIHDTEKTLDAVQMMPKWRGHLYNWYETGSLDPVAPLFVSTVDNGNLVASLWTLKQGCLDMIQAPLLRPALWMGLRDVAVQLAESARPDESENDLAPILLDLRERAESAASGGEIRLEELRALEIDAVLVLNRAFRMNENEDLIWWAREFSMRLAGLISCLERFAPWLDARFEHALPSCALRAASRYSRLTLESAPRIYREISAQIEGTNTEQTRHLQEALEKASGLAEDYATRLTFLASRADSIANTMDFSLLFDAEKKQFSVGYEEPKEAISKYNYDLLASEARTAVFIAIAKGEVPQESWFRLKRSYRSYKRRASLLSWSGTAFEYLMPSLWLCQYPNTLIDRGIRSMIRGQQRFGRESGIPWGISESSCAERNPDGHYRYHAFGVPGLALHRDDCSGDLVVAPYATFLAMMFDAESAASNLSRLRALGLLSAYGYYEAVDFTPERSREAGGHVLVQNWMAHHQGMILVAAANVLCDSVMQRRFHAEPRVAAIERLLHERQPRALPYEDGEEVVREATPTLEGLVAPVPGLRELAPKAL